MIINNPEWMKSYIDKTKSDILASKKNLVLNRNVMPTLDLTPKRYTNILIGNSVGTFTVPQKKNFFITYAYVASDSVMSTAPYLLATIDGTQYPVIQGVCTAAVSVDITVANSAVSINPPIKLGPGDVLTLNYCGCGGYYEDIY